MGDKRSIIRWVAASIVTLVAFLSGSSGAADLSCQGNVRVQTPVMPNAYQLPKLVAGPRPPTQPIPFSHAHHAGTLALECATCHVGAGANADKDGRSKNSKHLTLPGTQICMNCHIAVATDRHNIQTLAKYHAAGEGVPWIRVYRVLEGVKWTHKPRLGAGIKCQKCHGVVLGYRYDDSPVIVGDGTPPSSRDFLNYVPSARPVCLAPHVWLHDGTSLYDHFGQGFTLIVTDDSDTAEIERVREAARMTGVPLEVLRPREPAIADLYRARYVLIRPDQHIAWRGNAWPDNVTNLLLLVTGRLRRMQPEA